EGVAADDFVRLDETSDLADDFLAGHDRLPRDLAQVRSLTRGPPGVLSPRRAQIDRVGTRRLASLAASGCGMPESAPCERSVHRPLRRAALILSAIVAAMALAVPAPAQAPYPNRSIRIVVAYTGGTGIDVLARLIGQKLGDRLKVPVV